VFFRIVIGATAHRHLFEADSGDGGWILVSFQRPRLQFEILGESDLSDKHLISTAESADVMAIAMGRIYYRADLARLLQMSPPKLASMSEAGLVILAYTHLGTSAFRRWMVTSRCCFAIARKGPFLPTEIRWAAFRCFSQDRMASCCLAQVCGR